MQYKNKKKIKILFIIYLGIYFISFFLSAQEWTEVYWEQLEIYRDDWGIPHIFASNPRALGFGFGYVQAQDHWESMLLSYRLANGKLAEVLGESEAESDRFSIQVGHRYYGTLAYNNCDPTTRDLCEGFAEGVNSWILENREKLPDWVDGVQPQDIFSLWHAFIVSLAPLDIPTFQKRPPGIKSGFAFAVSSQKSREGTPFLALSSHQFYQGPFRWYEAHLICGDYNVYGCTLYGLPILIQGHSLKHAWALTPNQTDFADVFIESLSGTPGRNPKSIMNIQGREEDKSLLLLQYMSQSDNYFVRTANGLEQRFAPVHITPKGPLLLSSGNEFFSWKIGGYEDIGMFFQLWEMGRNSAIDKFQQALLLHQLPCFHILYVNNSGQLFYFYSSKLGVREPPAGIPESELAQIQNINWNAPVQSRFYLIGWKYLVPPEGLPSLLNPYTGYIQICGGPPNSITDDIKISNEDFTRKYVRDVENVVSRRVKSVLRTDKRSLRELQSLLLEDLSCLGVEVIPRIIGIAKNNSQRLSLYHPDLPQAVQILSNWNLHVTPVSPAPVIFNLWSHFFSQQSGVIPSIEVEPYYSLMNKNKEFEEPCLEALANAVRFLKNNRNSIEVNWGEIHRIRRGADEYSIGGSETGGTPFLMSEMPPISENWGQVNYGIGFASITRLGPVVESYSIQPFGNSESIHSPHFKDQWNLFSNKQMKKTRFYPEEVYRFAEEGIGRRLIFIPQGAVGEIRCISSSRINVSINSSIEPPAELPSDLVPFSVFIKPEYNPKEAHVQFGIRLYVPNDICAPENISQLALYYYSSTSGWNRFENQNADSNGGFVEGTIEGGSPFVVLGPSEILITIQTDKPKLENENAYQGIFTPGLPGEIPATLKRRGSFYFSRQGEQQRDTLPKPMELPVINNNTQKIENLESTETGRIDPNESKGENTEKSKKIVQKKKQKEDSIQDKAVKKNFTIRRK